VSISTLGRRGRLALAGAAVAAMLSLPTAALADTPPAGGGDATMRIDSVSVIGKVVAVVNLSVVCQPFDSFDWATGETYQTTDGSIEFGTVSILQAQGRTLATGASEFGGRVTCDGIAVNHLAVSVPATVSPWKNGTAVVSASISIADVASFQDTDSASLAPTAIRLAIH
jgi:hypothetical protein